MDTGKYFHKSKPKVNILMRVATVLLCLTLFSIYLVSGLVARYTSSDRSGDSARVAKFSVEANGTLLRTIEADLSPGEECPVTLEIINNSEVAVEYTVTVTNKTGDLPLSFRMEKQGESSGAAINGAINEDTNDTTFTVQRLPGSHIDEHTLYIEWINEEDAPTPMGKVDYITVTVTVAQID